MKKSEGKKSNKNAGATKKQGKISKKPRQDKREKRIIDPLTRLYIRFPEKLPEAYTIKEMHPLIKEVSMPRQKSARFCFLECGSEEDALTVKKALQELEEPKLIVDQGMVKAKLGDESAAKFHIQKTGRKSVKI